MIRKKAQEEMVGFGLILVIVAVIFIVLLSVYIKKPQEEGKGDVRVNSFVQASLQSTTLCEKDGENLTLNKLITQCQKKERCAYNIEPCRLLNETLKEMINESWQIGKESYIKGYSLLILSDDKPFLNLTNNVVTNNYKEGGQEIPPSSGDRKQLMSVRFIAYSA